MDKMDALTNVCTTQIEKIKDQIEETKAGISSSMGSKTKLENNDERIKQLEKDQDLNKQEIVKLKEAIAEVRDTIVMHTLQIKNTKVQLANTQVAFDEVTARTTINDKPKITEQITGKEDGLTDEQLRDGDNNICYSTAETLNPPLLGVEEAYHN